LTVTSTYSFSLQRCTARVPFRFVVSHWLSGPVSAKSLSPSSSSSLVLFVAEGWIHAVIRGWSVTGGRRLRRAVIAAVCDAFAAAVCAVKTAFLCAEATASCAVNVSLKSFPSSANFFLKLSSAKSLSWRIIASKLFVAPLLSRFGVMAGDRLSTWVGAVRAPRTRSAKFPVSVTCGGDLARRLGFEAVGRVASSARGIRVASLADMRASAAFALAVMEVQPLSSPVCRVRRPMASCCNVSSTFACRRAVVAGW